MNVLVTGGAGFIGSHLVEAMVARGDEVTVLDDLRGAAVSNLDAVLGRIRFEEADLIDADLDSLVHGGGYDLIVHLAANAYVPPSVEDPLYDLRLNFESTVRLLQAIRTSQRKPRLVYASSAAVYGSPKHNPVTEEAPFAPVSPYGVHKLAAEQDVRVFAELFDIHASVVRFFSTYGPRQRKQVVYDLIRKIEANPEEIVVHGDGTQVRDFVYVTDVVAAVLAVADHAPGRGEAFNAGAGTPTTIAELVLEVCRSMGAAPRIDWTGSVRPGDPQAFVADVSRLQALGYQPDVSLSQGVDNVVAWARSPSEQEAR
ncbi:MAG: NAD-dependent epimerase/dehydratase family protein [Actinomycetota bacterium]|nr:GDP-mannose 4,6-dehydratase [Actinomycetota bacterium]